MTDGAAYLLRGDARRIPLTDESVDLVVTSPPYWALRSYTDTCAICRDIQHDDRNPREVLPDWDEHVRKFHHYAGQLGSEPHWREFIDNLIACTAEMARVLKPSGSIFVNLGDKYAGSGPGSATTQAPNFARHFVGGRTNNEAYSRAKHTEFPAKSLMLLPERFRIACVDELGLIARAVIVWDKPNGLPESVTDRVRRSHEDWVHLVKQPRYYAGVDEIREAYEPDYARRKLLYGENDRVSKYKGTTEHKRQDADRLGSMGFGGAELNPLGKLPGSVWSIPSEPLRVPEHLGIDHYAAFPTEWPRRLILAFSPPGICCECGQGRAPVVDKQLEYTQQVHQQTRRALNYGPIAANHVSGRSQATILGYACACTPSTLHAGTGESTTRRDYNPVPDARPQGTYGRHQAGEYEPVGPWREYHLDGWTPPPTRPAVVLDCFVGTGTVPMVARALGRIGIGIDLSSDYLRLASWRVWESGHWQDVIARTTGRRLPKLAPRDPMQEVLGL